MTTGSGDDTNARDLSRRSFLKVGGSLAATTTVLAGCDALSTEADKEEGPETEGYQGKEAPMLAEQVTQKKLPRLKERLPEDPMVFEPLDEVGVFGGTLERAQVTPEGNDLRGIGYASLVEWNITGDEPVPGLVSKWDISQDGRVYTFTLRKGVKWSDGKPFTTDDLEFYFQHVYSDKELRPAPPTWLTTNGKPATFKKTDQYTFSLTFVDPHGLLLKYFAYPANTFEVLTPKHYLKQFNKGFVSADQIKAAQKKYKAANYTDLFLNRNDEWINADRPVLGPWVIKKTFANGETAEAERNPYYWKVDPDGRQLPYIDRIHWTFLGADAISLRAAAGDLDLQGVELTFDNVPLLSKSAEEAGYTVHQWVPDAGIVPIYINQSHKDPVLREVFQNLDFRVGLSHAINREDINDALLAGAGELVQPVAQPEDEYWQEGFGSQYLEYDLDEANRRLDAAGLTERDGDGMRLRPDGKDMTINVLTFPLPVGINNITVYEMLKRHWAEVGIHIEIKNVTQELFYDRAPQGDYDFCGYGGIAGFHWDIDPLWYVPTSSLTYWANGYGLWYESGGAEGVKPAGIYRQLQLWYDELASTVDHDKQLELGRKILAAHNENAWILGIVRVPFYPLLASNDLVNVRKAGVLSWRTGNDGSVKLEQMFFRNPDDH